MSLFKPRQRRGSQPTRRRDVSVGGFDEHNETLHHSRFALCPDGADHGARKRLEDRVEIETAQTRTAASPYYRVNPSGRVPYLVRDDGVGLEESSVICRYLDRLEGNPEFDLPDGEQGWEALRLGALASSLMDGVAVWGREVGRPRNEQSPTVIQHETTRAGRMIELWETEIDHPLMRGGFNMAQMALVCALGLEARYRAFRWREGHPRLSEWFRYMSVRPSIMRTVPPAGH